MDVKPLADVIEADLREYQRLRGFMESLGISKPSLDYDIPIAIIVGHLLMSILPDTLATDEGSREAY